MKTVLKNSRTDQLKVDDIKVKGKSVFTRLSAYYCSPFTIFFSSAWLRDCWSCEIEVKYG